jgi:uncharacterized protein (DUF58 family)
MEFHYRIPRKLGAWRPGTHPATTLGAGQEFVSHMSLYDRPDPRRLDLRASLRDVRGDWLVRVSRQRAAVAVQVVVDVSASMEFGALRTKREIAAEFVESVGASAFRVGDALGLAAFDERERAELFVPAMLTRGAGSVMAQVLRSATSSGVDGGAAVEAAVERFAGRNCLVFIVSDFHWPLAALDRALDTLSHAFVVPVVVWDRAEVEPPARTGLVSLRDMESGSTQTLWMRPSLRARWVARVAQRRAEIQEVCARHFTRPFFTVDGFDSEAMSRYFFEAAA